jgi:hypothetical protein
MMGVSFIRLQRDERRGNLAPVVQLIWRNFSRYLSVLANIDAMAGNERR